MRHFKRRFSLRGTLLGPLVLVSALQANQAADEATIRANAAKYVEAYNRRDSKTMASMWSPDAVYTDGSTGENAVGRDAIQKQLDHMFAGAEDVKLKIDIDSIDFISPNVAVEKGSAEVTYAKHPTEKSEYTAVHVKRDGTWMLDRVTDVDDDDNDKKPPEPPPSTSNISRSSTGWSAPGSTKTKRTTSRSKLIANGRRTATS